jgi:uncharacterized protein YkwD
MFRLTGRTAITAALLMVLQVAPAFAEGPTAAEQQTMLSLHNSYRAQHCVPALTWSAELAASAQKWAEKCWIGHSPRGKSARDRYSENIAWGGDRTAGSAVDAWYKEVDKYNYGSPGFASSTGHFTQMIWKNTKQIGCGVSSCYFGAIRVWVCHYTPQGNWAGQFPQNVPKRCK